MSPKTALYRTVAAVATGSLCFGEAALARGGGGGHSGGGGGGGGHSGGGFSGGSHNYSSSGSGGDSSLSFGGFITLLILAIVVFYLYKRYMASRGGDGDSSSAPTALGAALGATIAAAAAAKRDAAQQRPVLPVALATIRESDPAFEIESFMQRAEMTFFLVKRALQKNDAASLRPYLNDAVFGPLARGMAQMQVQHKHTLLESLNVRALHLVRADCTEQGQSLQIHFDLVYRAKTLDDQDRVVADEGQDTRHGERWTFVRAANARTPAAGGVTAARCPACGAELRLSLDGTCTHCKASVTNGSVDWVVAGVEPAGFVGYASDATFAIAAATVAEGLDTLAAADPQFKTEGFLARVRTGFVALQDAWCKQNLEAGRAFLSQGAYFAWRAQLETMAAEGRKNVMEHLAITSVTPIRVVHGRVFDDLTVRITAACADHEVDGTGRVVFGDKTIRPFSEQWTFQRSVGVATSGKPGTLENTCPSCGAPVALNQIGECRYCKAAVTSGKFDWVVSRIEQEDDGGSDSQGGSGDAGADIALRVGGAIVGGLIGSLLSSND